MKNRFLRLFALMAFIGGGTALSVTAQQVPTLNKCKDTLPLSAAVTENELREDNHSDLILTQFANTSLQCSTLYSDALTAEYGPIAPVLLVRASHLLLSKVLSNLTGFLSEHGKIGDFNRAELHGRNPNSLPYATEPLGYTDCKTFAAVVLMRVKIEPDKARADTHGLTTTQIQFMNERNKECLDLFMKDKDTPESRNIIFGLETYSIWLTETGVQNVLQFIANNSQLKAVYEAKLSVHPIEAKNGKTNSPQPTQTNIAPEIPAGGQANDRQKRESTPIPAGTPIRIKPEQAEVLLVKKVVPDYPNLARQARIQGTVTLDAVIGKDGSIHSLSLASGHPLLASAAIAAVKQWHYKPYESSGEPSDVATQVKVNFVLSPGPPQ